jgi:hypothetical protein
MIFGADKQNKNLKDAASKRIDTTPRTQTSNKYAAKIASSKNTSSGSDVSGTQSTQYTPKGQINQSDPLRGSWEGLDKGSSTYIQMNGTGYLNPSIQKARYNKKFASHSGDLRQDSFTKRNFRSIIDNRSGSTMEGSSSQIVSSMNKRNNLI